MSEQTHQLMKVLEKKGEAIYAVLYRLTLCPDAAEDLMQDLFVKLNTSSSPLAAQNLCAYVKRAAINIALDWRRQRKKAVPLEAAGEPRSGENTPIEQVMRKEELERLLDGVSRLRGPCREVIVMRFIEQLGYGDIAASLGKDEHVVRALCSRGLKDLRHRLVDRSASDSAVGVPYA